MDDLNLGGAFKSIRNCLALLFLSLCVACISDDITIKTSGTFSGTYVSIEAAYSGPLSFDFEEVNQKIEVMGVIVVEDDRIDFEGHGTLSKNPWVLDLDVTGTDFVMHIEGSIVGGHLEGSYTFTSNRWGNDSGSVDLRLG